MNSLQSPVRTDYIFNSASVRYFFGVAYHFDPLGPTSYIGIVVEGYSKSLESSLLIVPIYRVVTLRYRYPDRSFQQKAG